MRYEILFFVLGFYLDLFVLYEVLDEELAIADLAYLTTGHFLALGEYSGLKLTFGAVS